MPANLYDAKSSDAKPAGHSRDSLVIGLVNNMPDAAIRSTERQYMSLLDTASGSLDVTLRLFLLPALPRSDTVRDAFLRAYSSIDELHRSGADGLIVTGAEPRQPELKLEPYWQDMTDLVDWAEDNTFSTIWSCLAAHAAVLHLDGINRKPLDAKLSGVFECERTNDHALLAGAPQSWPVPHSRYNGLLSSDLEAGHYRALSSSALAGVDTFIKQRNSLFLFFQGHLEYEPHSLLREYLRDITRYLDGERETYPDSPQGYFEPEAAHLFLEVREAALAKRNARPLAAAAAHAAEQKLASGWQSPAVSIYGNWLNYIQQHKALRFAQAHTVAAQ